jgi:hypothetical protein
MGEIDLLSIFIGFTISTLSYLLYSFIDSERDRANRKYNRLKEKMNEFDYNADKLAQKYDDYKQGYIDKNIFSSTVIGKTRKFSLDNKNKIHKMLKETDYEPKIYFFTLMETIHDEIMHLEKERDKLAQTKFDKLSAYLNKKKFND